MPRAGRAGAAGVYEIGNPPNDRSGGLFDLSTPAGWTMLWFFLAVLFLLAIYMSL